jgi:hypothetical protein
MGTILLVIFSTLELFGFYRLNFNGLAFNGLKKSHADLSIGSGRFPNNLQTLSRNKKRQS